MAIYQLFRPKIGMAHIALVHTRTGKIEKMNETAKSQAKGTLNHLSVLKKPTCTVERDRKIVVPGRRKAVK